MGRAFRTDVDQNYQFISQLVLMKSNTFAFVGTCLLLLVALAFVGNFEIRLASAQVNATSSILSSSDATSTSVISTAASTAPIANIAFSTSSAAATITTPDATSTVATTTA